MVVAGCAVWVSELLIAAAVPCFAEKKAWPPSLYTLRWHLPSISPSRRKGKQPSLPSAAHPKGVLGSTCQAQAHSLGVVVDI